MVDILSGRISEEKGRNSVGLGNKNRQKAQINQWIQDICLLNNEYSLVLIRKTSYSTGSPLSSHLDFPLSLSPLRSNSTSDSYVGHSSLLPSSSAAVLPLHYQTFSLLDEEVKESNVIRLLWENLETKAVVITPRERLNLHEWTGWSQSPLFPTADKEKHDERLIHLLLQAEPGVIIDRKSYRKFYRFGRVLAWKCDTEFGLILESTLKQVTELMHIYRWTDLIFEGGWRVHRVTNVTLHGCAGTLISCKGTSSLIRFNPAGLRRLSAGIYECTDFPTGSTSIKSLSKESSKYKLPPISQDSLESDCEGSEKDQVPTFPALPNWQERSPRKFSSPTTTFVEERTSGILTLPRRKPRRSGSLSEKSLSLASLLFSKSSSPSRSLSIEEKRDDEPRHSLASQVVEQLQSAIVLPQSTEVPKLKETRKISLSTSAITLTESGLSPKKSKSNVKVTLSSQTSLSTNRVGKPNILILCEEDSKRQKIHAVLNGHLPLDRYIIYEIRWDQLNVGGWADRTALLVLSGSIPNLEVNLSILLQYLGDGGHLFAWCAESDPFGFPICTTTKTESSIIYGSSQVHTPPLVTTGGWGQTEGIKFPKILETLDSEGTSRPLTASVIGKSKESNEAVILKLDGGSFGGKAILSRVHFEEIPDAVLLSFLLSTTLDLDCSRFKAPEYGPGFLLGDHTRILNFLSKIPRHLDQKHLKVEFVPRGEKGSLPSHQVFPVHYFQCPNYFSTLQYFENLETRDLGRLLIYSDAITSVMNVLNGRPLSNGLTVIAKQQTAGRGRGKNVWLSPEGSALFACQIHVPRESILGHRLSLVQHLTALAMITAVPPHNEISLCVKWPNDVYLEQKKVGGILVESVINESIFVVNIGIGFNVYNSYPTTCLNQGITERLTNGDYIKQIDWTLFSVERYIARTLSELEHYLDSIEIDGGLEDILNKYTSNWIHKVDEEVNVEVGQGNWATCRILGIDEFGFMRVREVESGTTFSVQPDGNSFDITNKLISIKNN